ncbi:hypothetical protein [Nonomuraea gerenzanensis]|uniref:hypothetical protein n=1 Tax=Nonomuraea gerenzanensis TaxID=93944 RepID=UPI001CD94DCC|nr:hypothetical protein [Nonomuraea gerenzanensis]UBU08695.1 hypothetical protein LCN96_30385 [Nonomuraea gerenzanensis]
MITCDATYTVKELIKFAPPAMAHPAQARFGPITDDFRRPPGSVLLPVPSREDPTSLGGKRRTGPEGTPGMLVVGRFADPEGSLVGVAGTA